MIPAQLLSTLLLAGAVMAAPGISPSRTLQIRADANSCETDYPCEYDLDCAAVGCGACDVGGTNYCTANVGTNEILTGYCSGGDGTPDNPGTCMYTDDSGAPEEQACNQYDPCPTTGDMTCFFSTRTNRANCSGQPPPAGDGQT